MTGKEAETKAKRAPRRKSRWAGALLFVAAAALVVWTVAPSTLGEQARRYLETKLREHYSEYDVSVGAGRFAPGIGLVFDDIRVRERTADNSGLIAAGLNAIGAGGEDIVEIKRLVVFAETHPKRLLEKQNPIVTNRIVLDGVNVSAKRGHDGDFSVTPLWPLPKFGKEACPRVEIKNLQVMLDCNAPAGKPLRLSLPQITLVEGLCNRSEREATSQSELGPKPSTSNGTTKTKSIVIAGNSPLADSFELRATLEGESGTVQGQISGLALSRQLIDHLPTEIGEQLTDLRGLMVACDLSVSARFGPDQPIDFRIDGKLHRGRFEHPKLPLPLTEMNGHVSVSPAGVRINSFQAMWGDSRFQVRGGMPGFAWPQGAELQCNVSNLMLDSRVAQVLPAKLRAQWDKFQPRGRVDIRNARLSYKNGRWVPDATLTCKGVDVQYEKFPYPVRHLVGDVHFGEQTVSSRFVSGRVGGHGMQCVFTVPVRPDLSVEKRISIGVDGPVAMDRVLIESLSPRGSGISKFESFVRSLNPRGAIHLVRATLGNDTSGKKYQEYDVRVVDGTIRYDKFPYPIYNVQGTIRVRDQSVEIRDFRGVNANGGQIQCEGRYRLPSRETNAYAQGRANAPVQTVPELQLIFQATDVPLDESLRASLPGAAQNTWDAVSPSGVLDRLNVLVTQESPDPTTGVRPPIALQVAARENETQTLSHRALRLQPRALPYRLDVTAGHVQFDGNRVVIESLKAQHDQSRLTARGSCEKRSDGRWQLEIDLLGGSRLNPDTELIEALPIQFRHAMRSLRLQGFVGLRGRSSTVFSEDNSTPPEFAWDVDLQLEGNRFGDVSAVHSVRGEMSVRGSKDENHLTAEGQVSIDSMHVHDLQFTNVVGPFRIVDDQLKLGATIDRALEPIQGRIFGGMVLLNGEAVLSEASFHVGASLSGGQVPLVLAEVGQGNSDLKGRIAGQLELEGILGTTELLTGRGSVSVEEANLYQLPLLVQLLNMFSINPTEDVAFTNMNADFSIHETDLLFQDLSLWGSLIALHGTGTLKGRKELDLSFNTRVSPRSTFTQILRPLKSQRYTLWTVDVTGSVDDPIISRRALDGVGQTIERLIPGMNLSDNSATRSESAPSARR